MDTSKRNRYAGTGKRDRDYKKEGKYHATEKQKNRRVELNRENRKRGTYGNGDGKDLSHTKSGRLVQEKASANRSRNGKNGKSTKK